MLNGVKRYWYKLSIHGKQLVFYILIITCISLFSFYSFYLYGHLLERFDENTTKFFNVIELKKKLIENRGYITKYLNGGNIKDLNNYNESVNNLEKLFSRVEKETASLDAYFLIRAIKNAYSSAYDHYNQAIQRHRHSDIRYRIYVYKGRRIYQYMLGYIDKLSEVNLLEGNNLYHRLMRNTRLMQIIIFMGIILMTVVCLGFAFVFSNYLTRPVTRLAALACQMAKGNLDVQPLKVTATDEVGMLTESFNVMSASIREMVTHLKSKAVIEKKLHEEEIKNVTMQQLLKEAQFLSLQAQINPHFLFNTLNTISRVIMFKQNKEAIQLIESLSNLLRYNLGEFNKQVSLEQELKIIEDYLSIQKYRFGDRLSFSILCKDRYLLKTVIPCFSLQPLVENSMIHGIEPKEEGGEIRIRILSKLDKVIIKIIDNGVGISKKHLNEFVTIKSIEHRGHSNAIGIANVLNRLSIFTGKEDSFMIQSVKNLGTVVTIKLPRGSDDVDLNTGCRR